MIQPKKLLTGSKLPGYCTTGTYLGLAHFRKLSRCRFSFTVPFPGGKDKPIELMRENLPWPLSKDLVLPPQKTAAREKIARNRNRSRSIKRSRYA